MKRASCLVGRTRGTRTTMSTILMENSTREFLNFTNLKLPNKGRTLYSYKSIRHLPPTFRPCLSFPHPRARRWWRLSRDAKKCMLRWVKGWLRHDQVYIYAEPHNTVSLYPVIIECEVCFRIMLESRVSTTQSDANNRYQSKPNNNTIFQ